MKKLIELTTYQDLLKSLHNGDEVKIHLNGMRKGHVDPKINDDGEISIIYINHGEFLGTGKIGSSTFDILTKDGFVFYKE